MRKIKRANLSIGSHFNKPCEFQSLGQRIRDAIDQGVTPDVNQLVNEYDTDEDGDMVDPIADPRADIFDVVKAIDKINEKEVKE